MSDRPIGGFVYFRYVVFTIIGIVGVSLLIGYIGPSSTLHLENDDSYPFEISSVIIHVENKSFSYPSVKGFDVCREGNVGEYYWFQPLSFGPGLPGCMSVTINTDTIEKITYNRNGLLEIWGLSGTKYTLEKSHNYYRSTY